MSDNDVCTRLHLLALVALSPAALALLPTPAHAIPSPELVVGSLTSISQLVALGSAVLGGGALAVGARAGRKSGQGSGLPKRIALGLALLSLVSIALNAFQYSDAQTSRRDHLEAALLRPTPKAEGGKTLDPLLREIPYAEQVKHPLGLTTEEAEQAIRGILDGSRPDWFILDIRETAETEMGSFPKATKVRFPDLPTSGLDFTGRTALLICHNGNRSAETCAALKAKGIDCRFIKGGLEKWLVENRRMEGLAARTVDELRAIPDYPNHQTLLDTAEVKAAVAKEGAVFLDVRYPGEFAAAHLPGAINVPLRSTPTAAVRQSLADVPRKPVIVPCYDRRSCFFGEIVGLELTRLGHDFRGRYTVPWEYFVASPRPPHVEAWLAEANRSTWDRASSWLAARLQDLAPWTSFAGALFLLAALSRLAILPFAVKAERDQLAARRIEAEIAAVKLKYKDDPRSLARAISTLYRRAGLTPGRNLVALLFLPVLALSVSAASTAASNTPQSFLWVQNLADYDHTYLLPAAFGILLTLYVHLALARTRWQKLACWGVLAPLLATAGALMPAAADLYVVFSALLLLAQRLVVTGTLGRLAAALRKLVAGIGRRRLPDGVVLLDDAPERLADAGNKSSRLAQCRRMGLPVAPGLVLTDRFLASYESATEKARKRALDRVWRSLGRKRLAVRSSAAGEDGAASSFAGVFESVLEVDRSRLAGAVDAVLTSFSAARVASYSHQHGKRNILIQQMVEADYSGVLFTEDPTAPGLVLIEAVEGLADKLVSGMARPETYRFGRASRQFVGTGSPPLDFTPLLKMAFASEQLFDRPQDIEWAYARGRFVILQTRDITTPTAMPPQEAAEWRRLAALAGRAPAEGIVLSRNEMSEMLPQPTTLSLDLLNRLWAPGGSVDLALDSLGLSYPVADDAPPLYVTAFGRLYTDKREEAARAPRLNALSLRRIRAHADAIETHYRESFLPAFQADMQLLEAVDLDRLTLEELTALMARQAHNLVTRTHTEAEIINIAAQAHLDRARHQLEKAGLDAVGLLAGIAPPAWQSELTAALNAAPSQREVLIRRAIGHRARLDYELSEPRYGEDTGRLLAAAGLLSAAAGPSETRGAPATAAGMRQPLARTVTAACRFQTLKEDAKHHTLRELAQLRRIALAIGRRSGLADLVFHATLDELVACRPHTVGELARRASGRRSVRDSLKSAAPLASHLGIHDLERWPCLAGGEGEGDASSTIRGTRVSGSGIVEGRAVVVPAADAETGEPIEGLLDGDILVATMIHPAWLPQIVRAGGAVAEIGGWLSHMAIIAREHGTAMVVGVSGLSRIRNGDWLRLHPDGRIEIAGEATGDEVMAAE